MCFLSTIASPFSAFVLSKVLLLLVYCSVVDPVAPAWSNDLKSGTDFLCVTSNATTTTTTGIRRFPSPCPAFPWIMCMNTFLHWDPIGSLEEEGGEGWEVEN